MSKFLIRSVVEKDLEALHRLDRICFEPGIAYSRGQIRHFLRLPTAQSLLAESGGTVAGFAIGYRSRPAIGHLLTLDVDPAYRRTGVGRALLDELSARLRAAGARRIRLEVDIRNAGAVAFYERLGFRVEGRIPDYYGPERHAYVMGRELDGPAARGSGRPATVRTAGGTGKEG